MRKHLLIPLILAFGMTTGIKASNDDYALIILLQDSTTVTCDFTKAPQMSFEGSQIILEEADGKAQQWEFNEVLSWSFGTISGVHPGNSEQAGKDAICITDGTVCVTGKPNTTLTVCDTQGKIIGKARTDINGKTAIDLKELAPAIYILRFGKNSMKYYKR